MSIQLGNIFGFSSGASGIIPSDIAYQRPFYTGARTSYRVGDDKWNIDNNPYPSPPPNPLYQQQLDLSAGNQYWQTLLYDNIFGNTRRFTDHAGNVATKAQAAIDGTFYDHLTALEWVYQHFGGNWNDAIDHFHTLSLNGKSDYRVPNYKELQSMWFVWGRFLPFAYTSQGTSAVNVSSSSTRYDVTTYCLSGAYTTGGGNILKTTSYIYIGCRTFA